MPHTKPETYAHFIHQYWKELKPEYRISKKSVTLLNSLVEHLLEKIAEESSRILKHTKTATMSARTVETATRLVMKREFVVVGEVMVQRGIQAVESGTSQFVNYDSSIFPVTRVHRYLKQGRFATRVSRDAALFLAGALKYMVWILEFVGEAEMQLMGKRTLSPQHLSMAIRKNTVLAAVFGTVNVRQST